MSEMFDRVLQSAVRLPSRTPASLPQPDYAALIQILEQLCQIPDGLGETVLRPEEAAAIRRCGFAARAGVPWRCPLLPDELVNWNPLLWHLSDAIDPLWRPDGWKRKRAESRLIRQTYPLWQVERKILTHLSKPPYYMSKRQLQQKMWRYPARFFNRTISRLIANRRITYYEGYLFPYGPEDFAAVFNSGEFALPGRAEARYTDRPLASASSR